MSHGRNQNTLLGLAWNDRRFLGLAAFQHGQPRVEPQHALLTLSTVALKTMLSQQRSNLHLEEIEVVRARYVVGFCGCG